MVIDRNRKFIFIELPLTATTAISKEIREMYGCEKILYKHAPYHRFLKTASSEEKKYKSIGSIRNPADQIVSMFFKYKSDKDLQKKYVTTSRKSNGTRFRQLLSVNRHKKRSNYIIENNATFEEFFLKFFKLPYNDWSILDHKRFNYVIHFENLTEDYRNFFTEAGLPIQRDLPKANKTLERNKDFWSYYETDKAKRRAKFVFSPLMRYWGYQFPESWDYIKEPWYGQLIYNLINIPSKFYWKYLM